MSTMSEILARDNREFGYVLFLEGIPWAFTNRHELAGSHLEFSWIGNVDGERTVFEGLETPESVTYRTNPETGMLESGDGATFVIQDFDNAIIEYMRYVENPDALGERLSPLDDPAPAVMLDLGGNDVGVWGKFLNAEAIGQFGERNIFQLFPGDPMPGMDHSAYAGENLTIAPSNVYEAPTALDGRRCALYQIYKDLALDSWPAWSVQAAANRPLWYGTITSATAEAKTWKFQCDGPSSWLRRPLNRNRPTEWKPVQVLSKPFAANRFALEFRYFNGSTALNGASSLWDASDVIPDNASPLEVIAALNSRIQTVAALAGPDIVYSTEHSAKATFAQDGGRAYMAAKIDDNIFSFAAQWTVTMDLNYWLVLGFDVKAQFPVDFGDQFQILFYKQSDEGVATGMFSTPAIPLDYDGNQVTALIQTVPLTFWTPTEAGSEADSGGNWRTFKALSKFGSGGAVLEAVDASPESQELLGGFGQGYYLEGQTRRALRAPHEFSEGGGTADTTGYFLLRGTYTPEDGEAYTRYEVAKFAWRDDANTIGRDNLTRERLCVEEFIDPRWFGIRNPDGASLVGGGQWAVNDLEIMPMAILGYRDNFSDQANMILLSTMLGTGTGYWTGYEIDDTAVRTLGDNDHPDAVYPVGSDFEIADLGLGIYHDLIDWSSFREAAQELPDGGEISPLNYCKYGLVGTYDSQELIARILAPRAWSMGFVAGQYRLYFRPQALDFESAEATLGPDDFVEGARGILFIESVDLTTHTPKDRFEITYGDPLLSEATPTQELEPFRCTAQDPSSRTRHSNAEVSIDGHGMVPYLLWNGNNPDAAWQGAWVKLWGRTMATYYGSPYLQVAKIRVHHSKGRNLGPGSVVRFESSFGPSRDGVYALTNKIGRVTAATHNLKTGTTELTLQIQPGEATTQRRWAPIAQVLDRVATVEERHNAATRTFYCYKNAFGHDLDSAHDVSWFEEPAWLGVGGAARVYGWQWDGRSWGQTFSFLVENASNGDDSITYAAGSFGGTFREAQTTYLVLAPYDDQDLGSWPRSIFSVVTGSDFKFGGGPTKGFKLL